jgi:hypothetical protein
MPHRWGGTLIKIRCKKATIVEANVTHRFTSRKRGPLVQTGKLADPIDIDDVTCLAKPINYQETPVSVGSLHAA